MRFSSFRPVSPSSSRAERLLVPAAFVTCLGNSVQLTATALLVLKAEGSTLAVGWLFIAVAIPQALLSLLFGRLADRFDRRTLCIICDLTSALAALALPLWLLLGGPANLAAYLASFALAAISALFVPASNALIKERIRQERLGPFNANFEIATQAGTLLSAAVGGFMIQFFDVKPLFFFNAATFLASAVCLLALGSRAGRSSVAHGDASLSVQPTSSGAPLARLGLLYAVGNVVITVTNTILVVLVINVFHQGAGILGVADALAGIGIMFAAASYKRISARFANLPIVCAGYVGCAVLIALEPIGVATLLICIPLAGLTFGLARVAARTQLMTAVDESQAGRVFGATNAFGLAFAAAATVVISGLADHTEVPYAFVALGAFVALITAVTTATLRRPHARPQLVPLASAEVGLLEPNV
jgi:Major Facilitator Superfamily